MFSSSELEIEPSAGLGDQYSPAFLITSIFLAFYLSFGEKTVYHLSEKSKSYIIPIKNACS
jgi:hypothetical protein